MSLLKVGVKRHLQIDHVQLSTSSDSTVAHLLMDYHNTFREAIDQMQLPEPESPGGVRYLVNTESFLGKPVTIERHHTCQSSLLGKVDRNC